MMGGAPLGNSTVFASPAEPEDQSVMVSLPFATKYM